MKTLRKISDLFKVTASSPFETAMLHNGVVGFRIPEYQREYDWSEENINRLFCDCLSGFSRLSDGLDADTFTFLGTLILVKEKNQEEDFTGTSVAIVDGQQRLTTLTLIACALYERLKIEQAKIDSLPLRGTGVKRWISNEIEGRLDDLLQCAVGFQRIRGNKTYPYPRIIRRKDHRGRSFRTSEYHSPLAKFLQAFNDYADSDNDGEFSMPKLGNEVDARKLKENYDIIKKLIKNINDPEWYKDTECEQVSISNFARSGYRGLLDRLDDVIKQEPQQDKALSSLINCSDAHELSRYMFFSAYFSCCIVLTLVTTDDESAAFDIFDALNTTGEPLTALETLKPRVIRNENKNKGYLGSLSDESFQKIRKNLDDQYKETSKKQSETKELLVTFALYIQGEKIPQHLAAQRKFLRKGYDEAIATSEDSARRFVSSIADIAEFRRFYWTNDGIRKLSLFHPQEDIEQAQLYMSFIRDMKTKLALPTLARYWQPNLERQESHDFIEVLKAVTAFLILRRAASGTTSGIDSDFRAIMAPKRVSSKSYGLCVGVGHENVRFTPTELKDAFRNLLALSRQKISYSEKEKWVNQVIGNPLYEQSRDLVRFLLLMAAHQSSPSEKALGCWQKDNVRPSSHTNTFLNYQTWIGDIYRTVEHIAPQSESGNGWNVEIYKNTILRHSLGNLVLLPKKQNSAIGNDGWEKKKIFYLALSEEKQDEQDNLIHRANTIGQPFSKHIQELLQNSPRLTLLDPLRNVDTWNRDIIEARGRNIAELAWDYLWPWLK